MKKVEMDNHCSIYIYCRKRKACKILVMKYENLPLWRSKHIWESNIKMHLREVGCEGVN
jgi:hypothetical protein